jgi:hypothetical protein
MPLDRRAVAAFVIAPAIVPLSVAVIALTRGARLPESLAVASIYAAFTYAAALVAGLPLYSCFERRGWRSWWQYAVAGVGVGLAVLLALVVATGRLELQPRVALLFAAMGTVSTLAFRAIVAR